MKDRFETLDSLRGLAAVSVMLGHFFLAYAFMAQNTAHRGYLDYPFNLLKYTPLHIIWGGHEAVILFFLLSGFVLSLPFLRNRAPRYRDYLIKRVCRIYIPYIAAVFIAILAKQLFNHSRIHDMSPYFNGQWTAVTELKSIVQHVVFLGNFNSTLYDPILWSLVHEMRISILFPLIMLIVIKGGWKGSLAVCAFLSVTAELLLKWTHPHYQTNGVATLQYVCFFIMGALLAKYRTEIADGYQKLAGWMKGLLFAAAVLLYTFHWLFYSSAYHLNFRYYREDILISLGGCVFIVFALNSSIVKTILSHKLNLFLGKISYSLYLFHFVVLLSVLHSWNGKLPLMVLLGLSFALSFVAATISYYAIERTSIRLGSRMVSQLTRKRNVPAEQGIPFNS
jgi:peptidoglycan/LPS O-acetylase OafA/YrhL